jgi:uncharacterized protein (UPF0248 family)
MDIEIVYFNEFNQPEHILCDDISFLERRVKGMFPGSTVYIPYHRIIIVKIKCQEDRG